MAFTYEEALGARAAGLVDDDERPRRQLVLLGDAGDQARHLIGAAAGAGGNDELDRLGRLPRRRGAARPPSSGESREPTATRHQLDAPWSLLH